MGGQYKKDAGMSIAELFLQLSSDQQAVINRAISMRQAMASSKSREEWSLHSFSVCKNNGEAVRIVMVITCHSKRLSRRGASDAAVDVKIDLADPETQGRRSTKRGDTTYEEYLDSEPPEVEKPIPGPHDPFAGLGQDPNVMHIPPPPPPPPPPPAFRDPYSQPEHEPPPGAIPVDQFQTFPHHGQCHPFEPHPQFGPSDLFAQFTAPAQERYFSYPEIGRIGSFEPRFGETTLSDDRDDDFGQVPTTYAKPSQRAEYRCVAPGALPNEAQHSYDRRRVDDNARSYRYSHDASRREDQDSYPEASRRPRRRTEQRSSNVHGDVRQQWDQMQELPDKLAPSRHERRRDNLPRMSGTTDSTAPSSGHTERSTTTFVSRPFNDLWSLPSSGSFTPPSSPGLSEVEPRPDRPNQSYRTDGRYRQETERRARTHERSSDGRRADRVVFRDPLDDRSSNLEHRDGKNIMLITTRVIEFLTSHDYGCWLWQDSALEQLEYLIDTFGMLCGKRLVPYSSKVPLPAFIMKHSRSIAIWILNAIVSRDAPMVERDRQTGPNATSGGDVESAHAASFLKGPEFQWLLHQIQRLSNFFPTAPVYVATRAILSRSFAKLPRGVPLRLSLRWEPLK
ncbi:hypothetical protein Slin15195_G052100 [Septoria linicola]|uniref:Uncharacterized protein n=1 Tax=Septoria linicola TaxID=215465 RepID=A0A9Q9ATY8_9PEZI|nr:hypothetical protein Slin15195_G052100 [Septoria linicola]